MSDAANNEVRCSIDEYRCLMSGAEGSGEEEEEEEEAEEEE